MDDIKDIQKRESVSKFLDDRPIRTNPFGRNVSGEKAYRRAERIVVALHMLTNHVDPDEPVRRSLRQTAIGLLPAMLDLKDEMRSPASSAVMRAHSRVRELISVVRVAAVSGYASGQNAEIIIDALDELGNLIAASQRTMLSESVSLTKDDFVTGNLSDIRIKDIRDTSSVRDSGKSVVMSVKKSSIKVRSEGILEMLKNNGDLAIKDIAAHMPEYGEKTIQRELSGLIAAGKVKRTGDKRWSRYSVA